MFQPEAKKKTTWLYIHLWNFLAYFKPNGKNEKLVGLQSKSMMIFKAPHCPVGWFIVVNPHKTHPEKDTVDPQPWNLGLIIIFKKYFLIYFQREGNVGRNREKHQCVVASHVPPPQGTWPATQACALIGNWTGNPLVCRLALNPLSHTSQSEPQTN